MTPKGGGASLGQKILPDLWNQEVGVAKGSSQESRSINAAIDRAKLKLRKHFDRLDTENEYVTASMLKLAYKGKDKEPEKVAPVKTALEVTLTKWKTTEKKISSFLSESCGMTDMPLTDLRYWFAEDVIDYLIFDKGIGANCAMKYLKNTKHIVKVAVEHDWLLKKILSSSLYQFHFPQDQMKALCHPLRK